VEDVACFLKPPAFDELDSGGVDYDALFKMAAKFPATVYRAVHKLFSA